MRDKVISIFCLVDDILQGKHHEEDKRRRVSDSKVLTTALVSAMYFSGNHHHAIQFMKATNLIPKMLDTSRFSRRIHEVWQLLYEVFLTIGNYLKEFRCEMRYILDSFPVARCDNMRIDRCKLLRGKKWRGYTASLRRYFYGIKVQLLVTADGVPI